MKTETIRTITIEDFKSDPHLIDYVDENLIILDSVEATFRNAAPVKPDCFIIAFCMEGETSININNKSHALNADHCAIILPNTIIRHLHNNGGCTFRIVAISSKLMKEATSSRKETWEIHPEPQRETARNMHWHEAVQTPFPMQTHMPPG